MDEAPQVELVPGGVHVRDLTIQSKDARAFLEAVPEGEWADRLSWATRVGVVALERALVTQDLHYARNAFENLFRDVRREVVEDLPRAVETELRTTLGAEEGQVLHPVVQAVRGAEDKLADIRRVVNENLDPTKEGSVLHASLRQIQALLEEKNTESIPYKLRAQLEKVGDRDGALSRSVKQVVKEELEPYRTRVEDLMRLLNESAGAAGIIKKTPLAGDPFEEQVFVHLREAFHRGGCQVEWVGPRERPGDVLLRFAEEGAGYRIIVEAKFSETKFWGEKGIATAMTEAMKEYDADYGVFVSSGIDAVKDGVNYWYESASEFGPWIAVTFDDAIEAVRVLRILHYKRLASAGGETLDADAASDQLKVIIDKVKVVGRARRKLTAIKDTAGEVHGLLGDMRDDVRKAITRASAALHIPDAGEDLAEDDGDDEETED